MEKRVIILGAGFTGLSLAWRLCERGINVSVLEAQKDIGGLAGTHRENGYCMDVGPHSLFSEDGEILDIMLKLFNGDLTPRPRQVKFYYQGKYLDYPLTAQGVLFQMGIWSGMRAGLSFLKEKIVPRRRHITGADDETVEEWAISSFGEHMYRTFFKPYTEQFWKIPCSELSSRSIPTHTRMSFANTLRLLLHRRVGKGKVSLIERETLPTYYPASGFAEIAERIAGVARNAGAEILSRSRVTGVVKLSENRYRVRYISDGEEKDIEGTDVVSTIPVHQYIEMLDPPAPGEILSAAGKIDYRSLVALGIVTEKQNILQCGYIYMLDRPYNRVTEMNEFSPGTSPPGENIVMLEIPCLRDSTAWKADKEELFNMCIGSLSEDGILGPGDATRLFLVKAPHAYPVYRKDYAVNLQMLLDYIEKQKGLYTLGRTGEFMYMDVDRCMRRAFDFADDFLTQR